MEVSRDAAEENGEHVTPGQYGEQEDLYQTPEDTAAAGEAPRTFCLLALHVHQLDDVKVWFSYRGASVRVQRGPGGDSGGSVRLPSR